MVLQVFSSLPSCSLLVQPPSIPERISASGRALSNSGAAPHLFRPGTYTLRVKRGTIAVHPQKAEVSHENS